MPPQGGKQVTDDNEQATMDRFTAGDSTQESESSSYLDANTVVDFNGGQIAFGDECIEVLPQHIDSGVYVNQDNHISGFLQIVSDRTEAIKARLGEPVITEQDGELRLSDSIEGIVYSFKCRTPQTEEILKQKARRALSEHDIPSWVWAAYYAVNVVYIGGTHRPDERIDEHLWGSGEKHDGAKFTQIFPPKEIESVVLCRNDNVYQIEEAEGEYWKNEPSAFDTFVYQS